MSPAELYLTAPSQGITAFMATELLHAIEDEKVITRTFAQDAQSLGYVILYSLYKHAVYFAVAINEGVHRILLHCEHRRPALQTHDEVFQEIPQVNAVAPGLSPR